MRIVTAAACAALLLAPSAVLGQAARAAPSVDPAQVPAGAYKLDPRHASVVARLSHFGLSNYALLLRGVEGEIVYDPRTPLASKVTVNIDPTTVDTGIDTFDEEIESKFFEAGKHPKMTFTSRGLSAVVGNKGKLQGDLTWRGVTRPVTLDVTFNGVAGNMRGTPTMGFSAVGSIKRSDFGVAPQLPANVVGDVVTLQIEAEFNKA